MQAITTLEGLTGIQDRARRVARRLAAPSPYAAALAPSPVLQRLADALAAIPRLLAAVREAQALHAMIAADHRMAAEFRVARDRSMRD